MNAVRRATRDTVVQTGAASRIRFRRRSRARWRWLAGVVVLLVSAAVVAMAEAGRGTGEPGGQAPLLADDFRQPNGLITNEFAFFNQHDPAAVHSPVWILTSGSLFARNGAGWTGVPNVGPTGPDSVPVNDSSVFRGVTRRRDFQNVTVSFSLFVERFMPVPAGQPLSWQGVHVFLRYQTPQHLYVVSVDRRDGIIVIKKKVPGGVSNGGSYYPLASVNGTAVTGQWEQVSVSAVNNSSGGVVLSVWLDGKLRLRATDAGTGGVPPITQPGRVGLRGDFTEFSFRSFTVSKAQ